MTNGTKTRWEDLQSKKEEPYFFRNLHSIPFSDSLYRYKKDKKFVLEVIENLYEGDIYVFTGAVSEEDCGLLIRSVHEKNISTGEGGKTEEGCKNYHQFVSYEVDPSVGYSTVNHSSYYFRWNDESKFIFDILDTPWEMGKILSLEDLSSPSTIERIHFLHYPLDKGYVSSHMDFPIHQKINTFVSLTSPGKDYLKGGFYSYTKEKEKVYLDPHLQRGSLVCWYPTVYHGADVPVSIGTPDSPIDGRWIAIMNTVEPHSTKDRRTTKSVIV